VEMDSPQGAARLEGYCRSAFLTLLLPCVLPHVQLVPGGHCQCIAFNVKGQRRNRPT